MTANLIALPGSPGEPAEPDWTFLIPDREDGGHTAMRLIAHDEWSIVISALRRASTLAIENGRQIRRLVLAYVRYDSAAAQVMAYGAIGASSKTAVPQLSLWQVEMRAADSDATTAEMELCLSPRRRGSSTKVERPKRAATAADSYLKRSGGG